jgi:hypothetical protein
MRATTSWWTDLARDLRDELAGLRVAVYGSGGSPYHHAALAASWGALPVALSADAIRRGTLSDVDVIVFPGGGARAMAGMLDPLGVEGAAAIREWVAAGGMYVGSCAGSFLPAIVGDAYWGAHPESRELHMVCARLANGSDSEWEGLTSPGVGALDMEVTRPGHWLARDLPERFRLVHYNGPMFLPQGPTGGDARLGSVDGVARFVSRTPRFTPSEAFMAEDPSSVAAQVFDRGVAAGASTAIAAPYGEGVVVLYGSHPEFGFDAIQLHDHLVISLHDHCFVAPKDLSQASSSSGAGARVHRLRGPRRQRPRLRLRRHDGRHRDDHLPRRLEVGRRDLRHRHAPLRHRAPGHGQAGADHRRHPRAKRDGRIAFVVSLEGAAMIENELDRIDVLYGLGMRSLGIAYSEGNALGAGLKEPAHYGLTAFGRRAVGA